MQNFTSEPPIEGGCINPSKTRAFWNPFSAVQDPIRSGIPNSNRDSEPGNWSPFCQAWAETAKSFQLLGKGESLDGPFANALGTSVAEEETGMPGGSVIYVTDVCVRNTHTADEQILLRAGRDET